MPRTANAASCRTSASWLLAPPQTTRQRKHGMVASFSTAPSAAGGEHVDVLGVDFLGCYDGRAVGGGGLRAAVRVKVTDHQCRPRYRQVAAQWHPDIA